MRFETEWVQYDPSPGDPYAPSATPIYQTATFRAEEAAEFDYTRSGNPTRRVAEHQLARVERGTRAAVFASGMAAIDAVCSLVRAGEEILASLDLYGGTYRFFREVLPRRGVTVRFAESPELLQGLDRSPRLVFVETPTNPFQRITDLRALAKAVHAGGGLLAVDNSLLSPALQNPLPSGADLVVHSGTKFLSGHADVTAGAVVTRDEELGERIAFHQNACGSGLAPWEAFLLLRGMKTLPLRIARQQESAQILARALVRHPAVKRVHTPALPDHPGRDVHFRQARGPGSVLAFETGSLRTSRALAAALRLFAPTVSFGSVASTVCLPALMSHASIPAEVRAARSFPSDLVRLSVGIEHPDDLREDLEQALSRACSARASGRRRTAPSSP